MQDNGVARTRFRSKRDFWLAFPIWTTTLALIGAAVWFLTQAEGLGVRLLALAILLAMVAPLLWVLCGTRYTFTETSLELRCGPYRSRVPLEEIVSAEPSRNAMWTPARWRDRLLVRYGDEQLLVSPVDRAEFLEALASRGVDLVRDGDRVFKKDALTAPGVEKKSE
jgi:hypothetical protein